MIIEQITCSFSEWWWRHRQEDEHHHPGYQQNRRHRYGQIYNLFILTLITLLFIYHQMAIAESKNVHHQRQRQHRNKAHHQTTSDQTTNHNKKQCDLKKADRCTQILYIYGDPSYQMSNTVEEAEQFCNATREAELCVRNFANNCVKPFARQYINLMIAGPVHLLRKRCSLTGIKKYLEHKECINATKSLIDVCNDEAIRDTQRILKTKKDKWIPLSCCYISKSNQCSTEAITQEPTCDEQSQQYMKEAIKVFSGEVFDLFCGNDLVWKSPACQKVVKGLPVDTSATNKPLSVLPIVLEMMEQF